MQQAVRADRAHLREVDGQQRLDVLRYRDDGLRRRVGHVAGDVPVGHRHQRRRRPRGRRCGSPSDPADLHVAEPTDGEGLAGLAGTEDAPLVVPARLEVGVRALEEGQLGPCRDAAVERVDPELALDRGRLGHVEDPHRSDGLDAQRARPTDPSGPGDRRPLSHGRGHSSTAAPSRVARAAAMATRWVARLPGRGPVSGPLAPTRRRRSRDPPGRTG